MTDKAIWHWMWYSPFVPEEALHAAWRIVAKRYCGKWIDAGSIAYGEQKWAFYDAEDVERDVDNLVRAKGASRMAITDPTW